MKYQLERLVQAALATLPADVLPADIVRPVVDVERTRDAAHGDFATNIALQLAKPARRSPRQLAQAIVDAHSLERSDQQDRDRRARASSIFISHRIAYRQELSRIFDLGAVYGYGKRDAGESLVVEFVSANPTGPLHVGHGRQAALGDALAALLQSQGYEVTREFYYNDARRADSEPRALGAGACSRPQAGRRRLAGRRRTTANTFRTSRTTSSRRNPCMRSTATPSERAAKSMISKRSASFAVAYLRHEQDIDLQKFGVRFDVYYLESSLYSDGKVETHRSSR